MVMGFEIDGEIGELKPGAIPRRWEPSEGIKKHNERIHRESKYIDNNINLPFKFSKPKKTGRRSVFECEKCGNRIYISINTVGIICLECKKFVKVKEVVSE